MTDEEFISEANRLLAAKYDATGAAEVLNNVLSDIQRLQLTLKRYATGFAAELTILDVLAKKVENEVNELEAATRRATRAIGQFIDDNDFAARYAAAMAPVAVAELAAKAARATCTPLRNLLAELYA